MLGYTFLKLRAGTIDALSKYFVCNSKSTGLKHVGEYSLEFLDKLRANPSIIGSFKFLFVDEFQDINSTQFKIIQEFYKNGVTIFGVGDDAQNIYSFRGSDVTYMLSFKDHFPDSKQFFLTTNFRSTEPIVAMANACMDCQASKIPKTMVAYNTNPATNPAQHPTLFLTFASLNYGR